MAGYCALVPYYTVKLPLCNLDFGDRFTNKHFGDKMRALLPRTVTYDIARKEFSAFGEPVAINQVKARMAHPGCVRLVGWPVEHHGAAFGIASHLLTPVAGSGRGAEEIVVYDFRPFQQP